MSWWEILREYVPHLMALGFWLTSLAVFDKLRKASSKSFWVFMGLAFFVWIFLVIVKGVDLSEKSAFETRRQEVADAIAREVRVGQSLLDAIANDQRYQHRRTCRAKELIDIYAPKVEDWKTRVQQLLDDMLPTSGATERFKTVAASFPTSDCPEMDFNYWRLLAFAQNLNAIWESSAQYCARVGPTCKRQSR